MCELGVNFVETVILSVPASCRNLETLHPIWQQLEALVDAEKVFSLGMADLDKEQLEALFLEAKVGESSNLSFYTPDESGSYYGMVRVVRPSVRPSVHPW